MHDVRLLSVGLQYVTFRLIKHMVDGRINGVRISIFQIRGISRPQLLDPQTENGKFVDFNDHAGLKTSQQETPSNIDKQFILPETRVIDLHFCR